MRHLAHPRVGLATALAFAAAWPLSSSAQGVFEPAGPIGAADWQITLNALVIMLAIGIPTILATLGFAWWFRASNPRAKRRPHFVYSGEVELLVWSIPLLTILFLGGVIWIGSHRLDPFRPLAAPANTLEVQVVSLDWKWLFIYPDQHIAAVNQLVVPAGVPVHFSLTSASVMNAFFVPQLGSMIATMYGMKTQLHLQADQPGEYYGLSTQYSGAGFAGMHFTMHAVPREAFSQWVSQVRSSNGPVLNRQTWPRLAEPSRNVQPFTFSQADPGLFDALVKQHLPSAPGPKAGESGGDVRPNSRKE